MKINKKVGKREFIQHTSRYLQWVETQGAKLIITHQNHPALELIKIKPKTFQELRGSIAIKELSDINEHVLFGYDEWSF